MVRYHLCSTSVSHFINIVNQFPSFYLYNCTVTLVGKKLKDISEDISFHTQRNTNQPVTCLPTVTIIYAYQTMSLDHMDKQDVCLGF